jgi:hypothetical protein
MNAPSNFHLLVTFPTCGVRVLPGERTTAEVATTTTAAAARRR